jgi:hypothetical protein
VPIVPAIPLPFIQKRHNQIVAENNAVEGNDSAINGFAGNGDEQLAAPLTNGTAIKTPSAGDGVATEPLRVETNGLLDKATGQPVNGSSSSPGKLCDGPSLRIGLLRATWQTFKGPVFLWS